MRCNRTMLRLAVWAAALTLLGGGRSAWAVGTAADTDIGNRATVTFDVLGTTQTVESSEAGNATTGVGAGSDTVFKVDQMVDLMLVEESSGATMVLDGQPLQALGFTLVNTGNAVQDFALSTVEDLGDDFDGTVPPGPNGEYYIDDGDGVFDAAVDTLVTFIDELPADPGDNSQAILVWVVRDMPAGQSAGALSNVILTATALAGGATGTPGGALSDDTGPWQQNTLQIVFADGAGDTDAANNGDFSDTDTFMVETASMTVQKQSRVVSDPTGDVFPDALAIPGAIVEYTITLTNGGTAQATNVTVSDDLTTEITTNGTVAFNTDSYGAGQGIQLDVNGAGAAPLTNGPGDDEGEFVGNVVTVDSITLNPGENAVINFQVVIQ